MSELTGVEAKTIHRMLQVDWDDNDDPVFQRNERNPLECDAVSSMSFPWWTRMCLKAFCARCPSAAV